MPQAIAIVDKFRGKSAAPLADALPVGFRPQR